MSIHLHHLALGARDVASLAAFYRDVLGLRELRRHDLPEDGGLRSVWLDLGAGAVLMIEKTEQALRPVIDAHDAGLFLLALSSDEETLERRCGVLAENGVELEKSTEFTRYFRDPEGNRFALSSYSFGEVD